MAVYKVEDVQTISQLFTGWNETMIWTYLQGCMGEAFAVKTEVSDLPTVAVIVVGGFCFFAGTPNEELISSVDETYKSDFYIMVPQNKAWEVAIYNVYKERATYCMRYALKKEEHNFDKVQLQAFANALQPPYEMKEIDAEIFTALQADPILQDLCGAFTDAKTFAKHGLGVVVYKEGEIVAGAATYTYYNGGIEIEIDTKDSERKKGLATACGAQLILNCFQKGIYPSWDAQNQISCHLAQKLGYVFDKEYPVFEVTRLDVEQQL